MQKDEKDIINLLKDKNETIKKINKYTLNILSLKLDDNYEKVYQMIENRDKDISLLEEKNNELKTFNKIESAEIKEIEDDIIKDLKELINLDKKITEKIIKELNDTKKDFSNKNLPSYLDFRV